jgi:hypothetical protein
VEFLNFVREGARSNLFQMASIDRPLFSRISSPEFPTKDDVQVEVQNMRKVLCDLDMPLVFCHNDIHPGNVIHNEGQGIYRVFHNTWC